MEQTFVKKENTKIVLNVRHLELQDILLMNVTLYERNALRDYLKKMINVKELIKLEII